MVDIVSSEDVVDLERAALTSACYLTWVAAGATLGSMIKPGLGTVAGGVGGLIWAAKTCGPITSTVLPRQSSRFMPRKELVAFQRQVSAIQKITEDEALALAILAYDEGKISSDNLLCSGPQFNQGLATVLNIMRGNGPHTRAV